jgi:putative DNA primase/helicase
MNMQAIDKVLESLGDYSERGDEYRAKCPSHQGESDDSLAVREDDDGKVLLHCHTGCDFEEIVDALGLDMSDLFSKNGQASGAGKPVGPPPKEDRVAGTLSVEDLPGDSSEYMVFEKEDGTAYYIQRHKGAVYRVVGFDEDGDPILAAGLGDIEPILFGLPILREAIATGKPVIHTEGCKDALTAQRQLGMAGVTSGSCTSWKSEFVQDYEGAEEVWIVPDNDDEGRAYAQQIAQDLAGVVPTIKIVDLPGLPEKGDLTDWMDAGHTKEELLELVATAPALDSSQAWPEKPVALDIQLPAVEELRESLIPGPLSKWVFDVAKRMDNAAPDFVAAAAVVQAGALLGRKVGIRPKRHDDWVVIPNLWGGLVGMPASMKTPALEAALKPIKRLAAKAKIDYEDALKNHDFDKVIYAAQHKALKETLQAKAKELTLDKGSADDLKAFKKEFEELKEPEAPIQRRYVTNDTTIEKLAEILAENPDGILYYADELMRFLRGLDRVGREADRAFYLEAWNGSGSFEVDRIGRGSIFVPALCVSLLGGIQPGPLSKYVIDAMEDTDKADGLLQRFQVLVYPDLRSNPTDIIPDAKARNKAYEVFENLANLDAGEFGAAASPDDVPTIGFSEEAQEIFNEWRAEFEPRYGSKDQLVAIQSHMLKFRSLFASLALIFEAIDFVGGSSSGGSISKISAMRAAGWCEYLESHALRVYSPLMDTPERRAELLLHKILTKEIKPGAKVREIYRKQWSGLKTYESVAEALAILSHHGWVRITKVNPAGRGRPTEVLQVHPELRD